MPENMWYHNSNGAAEPKVNGQSDWKKLVMSRHGKDLCSASYLICSGDKGALIDAELSSWHDGAYIL